MHRVNPVAGWGERTYCKNLDLSSHQRPKARQTGLSFGLEFVTVVLGRWHSSSLESSSPSSPSAVGAGYLASSSSLKYSSQRPPFATVRSARVPGFQPTPPSAIVREEAANTVGLRLPSMSTNYVFACVV